MRNVWRTVAVLTALAAGACGGSGGSQQAGQAGQPSAPAVEMRWLRGLWANDIRAALDTVGLPCKGPVMENRTNVWTCESGTPLVTYKVRYFGIAPGKIDYINAVVTQGGVAKDALPLRVFAALAGLRFEGTWVDGGVDRRRRKHGHRPGEVQTVGRRQPPRARSQVGGVGVVVRNT
jgi:hypothetical protein